MSTPVPSYRPSLLETGALTHPVPESDLDGFITHSKATGQPWCRMTTGLPRAGVSQIIEQLLPVVIPLVTLCFFLAAGGTSLVRAVWRFTFEAPFPLNLVVVVVLALIAGGVVGGIFRVVRLIRSLGIPRSWWEAAYRITRFAGDNQLYYGHDDVVSHSGVIFLAGTDRVAERRLATTGGRRVEIGNYRYTVTGENRDDATVFGWGYVAITLDRRLPHLLLDAVANNGSVFGLKTSNLPVDLSPDQRVSLGGEFDQHFTLYAPANYGRDAFLIFTPDVMALFIDRLGTFDVEIVDDTLFVYGDRFDLLSPQTYAWLQEVVDTVVARTVRRTERYSDNFALLQRAPAPQPAPAAAGPQGGSAPSVFAFAGDAAPGTATNTVAEGGQRLRRRRWGVYSIIGLALIAFWVYDEFLAPALGLPRFGP